MTNFSYSKPQVVALPPEDLPSEMDTEFKLILCVRTDLNMSVGKIAAQCSHATLGKTKNLFPDMF